jgi:hypothetical protein
MIISYGLCVAFLALYLPFALGGTPDKEWVDLIYYVSAAFVLILIYISGEFDKDASSLQRQVAAEVDALNHLQQRERDFTYLSEHSGIISESVLKQLDEDKNNIELKSLTDCQKASMPV